MSRMQRRTDEKAPGGPPDLVIKAASASETMKDEARLARAGMMLERGRWAAAAFARLDRDSTLRIAKAAADAGFAKAQHYAEWAVKEITPFVIPSAVRDRAAPDRGAGIA